MGAPKGNRFWKARSRHGRKLLWEDAEELKAASFEYFEWVEENPLIEMRPFAYQGEVIQEPIPKMRAMTIGGLCIFLGMTQETWQQYRKKKDFSSICSEVEEIIRTQKFTGAAADMLNPSIIARDLGLADKVDNTSSDGTMSPNQISDEELKAELKKYGIEQPDS